jgi:hypothetical protein
MSYNVRDDNATFGPATAVELNNGAAAPMLARLQVMEPVNFYAAAAAQAVTQTLFICPPAASVASGNLPLGTYQVLGCSAVFSTASTSGTLQIEKATGTTAPGSGTNLLTGTMSLSGTANTVVNGTVISNPNTLTLNPGDRLNAIIAGTVTNIVDLCIDIYVIRVS